MPNAENLKPFKLIGEKLDEPLAKKAIATKLPISVDSAIRSLPNPASWMRRVLIEAAKRELMSPASEQTEVLGDQ